MMELQKSGDHAHTDCFVLSGSKILEGVGKYVIVAIGTKSFNGRIMMGMFLLLADRFTRPFVVKTLGLFNSFARRYRKHATSDQA